MHVENESVESFSIKSENHRTLAKKAPHFFGSQLKILTFLTYFTKSKT